MRLKTLVISLLLLSLTSFCWAGVDLNGDADYIDFGDVAYFDGLAAISVSCWIRPEAEGWGVVSKWGSWSNASFLMWADSSGTDIHFGVITDSNSGRDVDYDFTNDPATYNYPLNAWTHFCGTWSEATTEIRMYADGVEVANETFANSTSGTLLNSNEQFEIGKYLTAELNGQITDVAIWSVQLTAGEVELLAKAKVKGMPLQVQPSNLIGYWALDDYAAGQGTISGLTFVDRGGNGRNGTGVDADNDSDTIGEEILTYPRGALGQ